MSAQKWINNTAMELRRAPWLHKPLKWVRRKLVPETRRILLDVLRWFSPLHPSWGPPRGFFKVEELIRGGRTEGRMVLEGQGEQELPAGSLQERCGLLQHREQPWPVMWSRHRNARLAGPSLALMNDRKELAYEAVYRRFRNIDPAWLSVRLPAAEKIPGRWTSLVSAWVPFGEVPTFSHWIMDALPRLALLPEFPPDTGILIPSRLAPYQKETLELLGVADRVRPVATAHVVVEDYYFSSPTAQIACYNPYAVGFLRSRLLPKADPDYAGPRRFYIQRRGKSRGVANEAEVVDFFRRAGWGIIDTEQLTFAQELKLFSDAEAFAGVLGSGFTNAIWCRPGCKVISFVADSWQDGWVEWICGVNQLDYRWDVFPSNHRMMADLEIGRITRMLADAGVPVREGAGG
jgi:hypothetical protein